MIDFYIYLLFEKIDKHIIVNQFEMINYSICATKNSQMGYCPPTKKKRYRPIALYTNQDYMNVSDCMGSKRS